MEGDSAQERRLREVASQFVLPGAFLGGGALGIGHINETLLAEYDEQGRRRRYVFQRINRAVFADPELLMANVERVLDHLRRKHAGLPPAALARKVPALVPCRAGGTLWRDEVGECWRVWIFIEGTHTLDVLRTEEQAYRAARAFGEFLRDLADLPAPPLAETLAGFHDTPARCAELRGAIGADAAGRVSQVRAEIDRALSHEPLAAGLLRLRDAGLARERPTHNDTKIGNVLLDRSTGEAVCVVDLDTVMPGLALFDFGDLVRSASTGGAEDDPARAAVRPELFGALARGFLEGTTGTLAPAEREALVLAAQVITLECAVRFLTDHLAGDRYFRIRRPGQNLDRCRAQLALLETLIASEDRLRRIVRAL